MCKDIFLWKSFLQKHSKDRLFKFIKYLYNFKIFKMVVFADKY